MSTQKHNHKTWMQARRDQLVSMGGRCREAVSTGWEGASRGIRALARVGGGFLTASWDGRYGHADNRDPGAGVSARKALRPPTTPVAAIAEGRLPQRVSSSPVAFVRPSRFSMAAIPAPVQQIPAFEVTSREEARRTVDSALPSSAEKPVLTKVERTTERQTDPQPAMQFEELFTKKCEEFSSRLAQRLDSFCEETSARLDALSEQAIHRFSEALSQQTTEALSSLMTDWAEQNRVLLDAECHTALDRFASRLEKLSSTNLENQRKEIHNLSANLKLRLRGVAHALQDLGPSSYRSS